MPSTVTDRPQALNEQNQDITEPVSTPVVDSDKSKDQGSPAELPGPSEGHAAPVAQQLAENPACSAAHPGPSKLASLLETVRPLPKAGDRKRKAVRKRESKSRIYTDTPEYNEKESLNLEKLRKRSTKKSKTAKKKHFL